MSNSLPYVFLLAAVSLGLAAFLFGVLDAVVGALIETDAWTGGSEGTMAGRTRVLAMWDYLLVMVVSSVSLTVLWASRRGR